MTDLSKCTLAELDAEIERIAKAVRDAEAEGVRLGGIFLPWESATPENRENWRDIVRDTLKAVNAEIERRKAAPDYAAWEPKWQAFEKAMDWPDQPWGIQRKEWYIRALIAAHNTPLAGEDEGWTEWLKGMAVPNNVSLETHEIQFWFGVDGISWAECWDLSWTHSCYRYRPKQTDDWIPWTGGECPVLGDTLVAVKLRGHGESRATREGVTARHCYWIHKGSPSDIIAYRVVKEP